MRTAEPILETFGQHMLRYEQMQYVARRLEHGTARHIGGGNLHHTRAQPATNERVARMGESQRRAFEVQCDAVIRDAPWIGNLQWTCRVASPARHDDLALVLRIDVTAIRTAPLLL